MSQSQTQSQPRRRHALFVALRGYDAGAGLGACNFQRGVRVRDMLGRRGAELCEEFATPEGAPVSALRVRIGGGHIGNASMVGAGQTQARHGPVPREASTFGASTLVGGWARFVLQAGHTNLLNEEALNIRQRAIEYLTLGQTGVYSMACVKGWLCIALRHGQGARVLPWVFQRNSHTVGHVVRKEFQQLAGSRGFDNWRACFHAALQAVAAGWGEPLDPVAYLVQVARCTYSPNTMAAFWPYAIRAAVVVGPIDKDCPNRTGLQLERLQAVVLKWVRIFYDEMGLTAPRAPKNVPEWSTTLLDVTAKSGSVKLVRFLAGRGAGQTTDAIVNSASHGHLSCLELFVEQQYQQLVLTRATSEESMFEEPSNSNVITALHVDKALWFAVQKGHKACVRWLLHRFPPSEHAEHLALRESVLIACQSSLPLAEWLHACCETHGVPNLKYNSNGEIDCRGKVVSPNMMLGTAPMDHVAQKGLAQVLAWVHRNYPESCRMTPEAVEYAAGRGHCGVVEHCYQFHASEYADDVLFGSAPNVHPVGVLVGSRRFSPMSAAVRFNHLQLVEYLAGRSEPLWKECTHLAVEEASFFGYVRVMRFLLENELHPFSPELLALLIHQACSAGKLAMLEYLTGTVAYSDPSLEVAREHATGLAAAAQHGHIQVLEYVTAHVPEMRRTAFRRISHRCPLVAAASAGEQQVVEWLCTHRDDLDAGAAPLFAAARAGHIDTVEWLHEHREAEYNARTVAQVLDSVAKSARPDAAAVLHFLQRVLPAPSRHGMSGGFDL